MPSKYDPQYLRYLFQNSRSWTNLDFSKTKPNAFDENWTLSKNWEQTRLSIKNLDSKLTKRERGYNISWKIATLVGYCSTTSRIMRSVSI